MPVCYLPLFILGKSVKHRFKTRFGTGNRCNILILAAESDYTLFIFTEFGWNIMLAQKAAQLALFLCRKLCVKEPLYHYLYIFFHNQTPLLFIVKLSELFSCSRDNHSYVYL